MSPFHHEPEIMGDYQPMNTPVQNGCLVQAAVSVCKSPVKCFIFFETVIQKGYISCNEQQ